jgi:hypothetical protein
MYYARRGWMGCERETHMLQRAQKAADVKKGTFALSELRSMNE